MANKTRADIIAQLREYVPQLEATSHDTAVDNLIDLAAEEISMRHNFSYFANETVATVSLAADSYTKKESDFTTFTNLKEVLRLEWIKSATGENGEIKWMPFQQFLKRYPYHDYSSRTTGKPTRYTRAGEEGNFILNRAADEAITLRAWYQQYHGAFTTDTTSHSFQPNMLGFQAIVACVLGEVHDLIPGIEMSQKAIIEMQKKEAYIQSLINYDMSRAGEPLEMVENIDSDGIAPDESPYGWIS